MLLREPNLMRWKSWLLVVIGVSLLWPFSSVQAARDTNGPEASERAPDRSPRVPTFQPDGDESPYKAINGIRVLQGGGIDLDSYLKLLNAIQEQG